MAKKNKKNQNETDTIMTSTTKKKSMKSKMEDETNVEESARLKKSKKSKKKNGVDKSNSGELDKNELADLITSIGFDQIKSNSSEVDIEAPQPKKKPSKQEENVKLIKNLKKQAPDAVPSSKPQQAQQTGIRAAHVTKINRAWEPLDSAEPEQAKLSALMEGYNKRDSMLVECGECWFNIQIPEELTSANVQSVNISSLKAYMEYASNLLKNETQIYQRERASLKGSDTEWLKTLLRSGASKDKINAMALLASESALHNLHSLSILVENFISSNRRDSVMVLEVLVKLFLESEILPNTARLALFKEHPFYALDEMFQRDKNRDKRDRILMLWLVEHQLKKCYQRFVEKLQLAVSDSVKKMRDVSLDAVYNLLSQKPEQEQELLTTLIGKLGDKRTRGRVVHQINSLIKLHPLMSNVIAKELDYYIYRLNLARAPKYYALSVLSSFVYTRGDVDFARDRIRFMLEMFRISMRKIHEDCDVYMIGQIISAIYRAYPFADLSIGHMDEYIDSFFKAIYMLNFNNAVRIMTLLQLIATDNPSIKHRFLTAVYRKLLDPDLKHAQEPSLLNMCYNGLSTDDSVNRIQAFVKRLTQVCCMMDPPFTAATLLWVSQIYEQKPAVKKIIQSSAWGDDSDEEEHFMDAENEDEDVKIEDTKVKGFQKLSSLQSKPSSDGNGKNTSTGKKSVKQKRQAVTWFYSYQHVQDQEDRHDHFYDPTARNPEHSGAEYDPIWELHLLNKHYHPVVRQFTQQLYKNMPIEYEGNPFQDFTHKAAFDRIANKKAITEEGVAKWNTSLPFHSNKKKTVVTGARAMSIFSDEYRELDTERVPIHERFIHRYMNKNRKLKDIVEHVPIEDDAVFEAYLNKHKDVLTDYEQEIFDFASDYGKKKKASGESNIPVSKKKDQPADSDNESDDSDDGFDSDDSVDMDMDWGNSDDDEAEDEAEAAFEEYQKMNKDAGFDEENIQFDSEDEQSEVVKAPKNKKGGEKRKNQEWGFKAQKKSKDNYANMGDRMGEMLETGRYNKHLGTSMDVQYGGSKTGDKQMKWEQKRFSDRKGKRPPQRKNNKNRRK